MPYLKGELTQGVPGLCPTRWTVHTASLESVCSNFIALQTTWEEAVDVVKDTKVKARITGVAAKMNIQQYGHPTEWELYYIS